MSLATSNIPTLRNGDQMIGFMKAQDVKNTGGYQDWASLHTWYQEDPLKNHMKLQTFWGQQTPQRYSKSMYNELLANKQVLEVNGWEGKFTYDVPVEGVDELITMADCSDQEFAGYDGTTFKIVLSEDLAPGTTFSADAMFGMELVVTEDDVKPKGDGFEHTVMINTNNREAIYPNNYLAKGICYYVTGHGVAEFGTKLAKVRMPKTVGYETFEFQLGSIRGVESMVTGKADSVNLGGAIAQTADYLDKIKSEAEKLGELAVMMDVDVNSGNPNLRTARVGSVMEYLTLRELDRITANSLIFQRGGEIKNTNGVTRYNEGLWHQLRRGFIIKYGRRGGLTREHIQQAVDYVFRVNPDKDLIEREVKFKCGTMAYRNVLEIFDTEVNAQLNRLAGLLGADRILPSNPVSGDLYNLSIKPVRFVKVFLPGIGNVEIEEDTSLNRMHLADRFAAGFAANGYDHTTYSMIIWDAADQEYSNNRQMPRGTTLIEGGNADANLYLVKPEGNYVYWGRRNGRYDTRRATDIVASFKEMASEFFAYNNMCLWLKDVSRFVMIELDEAARKGFN